MEQKRNYRSAKNNLPSITDLGKLQPQAKELEEAVLGALMLEKDAYSIGYRRSGTQTATYRYAYRYRTTPAERRIGRSRWRIYDNRTYRSGGFCRKYRIPCPHYRTKISCPRIDPLFQ